MSKIEVYRTAKHNSDQLRKDVDRALGRDKSDNDKHRVIVTFSKFNGDWSDLVFSIHASYGYYGSSSGYSATSETMGKYLAKEIQKNSAHILDDAVCLAEQETEKLRKEAEEEAKLVLQAVVV